MTLMPKRVVLISGGRHLARPEVYEAMSLLWRRLDGWNLTATGWARGADLHVREWARAQMVDVHVLTPPKIWWSAFRSRPTNPNVHTWKSVYTTTYLKGLAARPDLFEPILATLPGGAETDHLLSYVVKARLIIPAYLITLDPVTITLKS